MVMLEKEPLDNFITKSLQQVFTKYLLSAMGEIFFKKNILK